MPSTKNPLSDLDNEQIRSLKSRIQSGEIDIPPNLAKAIRYDWFGNLHPITAKARVKQIPPSWYNLDELSETEKDIYELWLHQGYDAEKIAAEFKKPKDEIKKHLMVIKTKLKYTLEPRKGDWQTLLWLSGRGFGKTRSGAELVKEYVRRGWAERIALIAPTPGKARDDLLRKLHSGLLQIYPEDQEPDYKPTKKRLEFANGAEANIYSGANPEEIRGPEFDLAWLDEFAAFKYPRETWDNLQFALRLGEHPQAIITTTPKPIEPLIDIHEDDGTITIKGSTYENEENLPDSFIENVVKEQYEGTTLGKQEIYAEILDDNKGALWDRKMIRQSRIDAKPESIIDRCERIVVGIDPAVGDKEENDETGIVVAGSNGDIGWVLEDGSMRGKPNQWARRAEKLFHKFEADRIVAETNQGGDMVEQTIRTVDSKLPYTGVRASKGKRTRAEPVSALYEQGRVHHVGTLGTLEDQLVQWQPGVAKSPDRLDALVYALSELMLNSRTRQQGWAMYAR